MSENVVVVGLGQLGQLLSEGLAATGHTVIPVRRDQSLATRLGASVRAVVSAVGEDSAQSILDQTPEAWLDRLVLLQNELRPELWLSRYRTAGTALGPSVLVVWFEKKQGQAPHVVLPSVVFGPQSELLLSVLSALNLPVRQVHEPAELYHELCLKNLYILGLNLSGLRGVKTAGELLSDEGPFDVLVDELIELEQASLTQAGVAHVLHAVSLKNELRAALLADPGHACAGRTARARLLRTLALADKYNVALPLCRRIAQQSCP